VRDVPGAQREDAMGENVQLEAMKSMSVHFFPQDQFL
jgi:hypothetical protein